MSGTESAGLSFTFLIHEHTIAGGPPFRRLKMKTRLTSSTLFPKWVTPSRLHPWMTMDEAPRRFGSLWAIKDHSTRGPCWT